MVDGLLFMSHLSTAMRGVFKKKKKIQKIRKISIGNFRLGKVRSICHKSQSFTGLSLSLLRTDALVNCSAIFFGNCPREITMDTSKRTYELPMTFPDRVVRLIYGLSNRKSSLTNQV